MTRDDRHAHTGTVLAAALTIILILSVVNKCAVDNPQANAAGEPVTLAAQPVTDRTPPRHLPGGRGAPQHSPAPQNRGRTVASVNQLATAPAWIQAFAECVWGHESIDAGWYTAQNPTTSASGAYQFLDSTWQAVTGLPGSAKDYPPTVQDNAFVAAFADGAGASHWNGTGC